MKTIRRVIIVTVGVLILMVICKIILSLRSCRAETYYYSAVSDDWTELLYYTGEPGDYLGKEPGDIFCNLYELHGLSPKEFVYAESAGIIGFGSSASINLLSSGEVSEPIKTKPIKRLVITNADNDLVVVDDRIILKALTDRLAHQSGEISEIMYLNETNAAVHLDVDCNLVWSCVIEQRTDNTIHLIGYDQKTMTFRDYDLTDLLIGRI